MGRHTRARTRRRRVAARTWYAGGVAVAALALIGTLAFGDGVPFRGKHAAGPPALASGCMTPAIELMVVSSADKVAALEEIAHRYESTDPAVDGRCIKLHIGYDAGAIGSDLTGGSGLAGRPAVWLPESTLWVRALAGSRDKRMQALAVTNPPSIASSPTVLAMPRPMAEALGWPDQVVGLARLRELAESRKGWAAVGHPEWGAFRIDQLDPRLSTAKAQATVALAYALTGTASPSAPQVGAQKVVRALFALDRAAGPLVVDPRILLAGLRHADDRGTALEHISVATLDERSVLAYNHGNEMGVPTAFVRRPAPKVPLAAFYPPEGTPVSDHPFVVLTDVPEKRRAAEAFRAHLEGAAAQAILREYGFRDRQGASSPDATADHGVLPRQPGKVQPQPEPAVVRAMLQDMQQLRARSNVLTVLDVSGSMAAAVPGSALTRMALAKRAAITSLAFLADDDLGALWTFSTARHELVTSGPMRERMSKGTRRDEMRRQLQRLEPGGDTALYDTIWQAHRRVSSRFQPNRRNSVILVTDGRDDVPAGLTLTQLLRKLRSADRQRRVRIILIAYGAQADVASLRKIATATGGAVFGSPDPANIDEVFAAAIATALSTGGSGL